MLEGKRPRAGRIVVYDGDGYLMAGALAELLAREGREVELVTGYDTIAPFCAETLEDVLVRERLHAPRRRAANRHGADGDRARAG